MPTWADEEKTSIRFYLSPHEQRLYESGWFSCAERLLWAKVQGPVLKAPAKSA